MTRPKIGIGHDIVLGLLDDIPYGVSHGSIQIGDRSYGISPSVHDKTKFVVFHWDVLDSEAEYVQILTDFGLLGDDTCDVTVYVKNERLQWTLYNGTAMLPEAGEDMKWERFFPRNLDLYVCDLQTFV